MRAYERLSYGSEIPELFLGEREAQRAFREDAAVLRDEALHLFLQPRVERIPRSAHIGKFGLAAFGRNNVRAKQRVSRGNRLVAAVAVPEPIADHIEEPLPVLATEDRVSRSEIRNIRKRGIVEAYARLGIDLPVGTLQLTEAFGERDLLLGGDRGAAAKYQHGVTVHRILDCRSVFAADRLSDIDS